MNPSPGTGAEVKGAKAKVEERIIFARSFDEGMRLAEQLLQRPRADLEVEILRRGRPLLFGLYHTPYKLRVRPRGGEHRLREPGRAEEIERLIEEILGSLEDLDGFHEFSFTPQGVWLTVHPPRGKGKPVAAAEVYREIDRLGLKGVDHGLIIQILREASGKPVRIGEAQPARLETTVTVSPDGLEAYLTVKKPRDERPIRVEELHAALQESGVTFGIDTAVLENMAAATPYDLPVPVARGIKPTNGMDGRIEYLFTRTDTTEKSPAACRIDRVNHRDHAAIPSVYAGQVLARCLPPTPGQPGMSVRGEPLPARDGKPVRLRPGKNVELSADGNTLYATAEGRAMQVGDTINVYPVHFISGDVDYSTGNVDFAGCVIIAGSVRSGFRVRAEGDVEIGSYVEDATIEAGGSVVVKGGFAGKNRGVIRSGGDVVAKFVENGHVIARGNVVVSHAIMHSQVTAGGKVAVGGKGYVVGGAVRARSSIRARTIGSRVGTRTELEIGIIFSTYEALHSKEYSLEDKREKLARVERVLSLLEQRPGPEREGIQRLLRARLQLLRDIEELEKEIQALKRSPGSQPGGYLEVTESILPGTRITIGEATLAVVEEEGPGIFREKAGKIEKGV